MRPVIRTLLVACAASAVAACTQAGHGKEHAESAKEEHETEIDVRKVAGRQTTSVADAVAAALAGRSGEALEAGLEAEMENDVAEVFIEVMVLDAAGHATEVRVDAASGKVLSAEAPDEADETQEMVDLRKSLPAGHMALADLARRGAGAAPGKLVSAAFDAGKSGTLAELKFVDGATTTEVKLDPKTGAVVSKKSKSGKEEDEDDEDDEKDEKEEHGGK